ncbi:hypothetical protein D3C86_1839230 [compost metagenome]
MLGAFRVDQDHLGDEVELLQRRGRIFRLKHVVFQKEGHVIQEFDGDLAVDAKHRAIYKNSFARFQRDTQCALHFSPSLMMVVMSIMPWKLEDSRLRIFSVSLSIQMAIEIRLARSSSFSWFSGARRSSMKRIHRRRVK